LAGAAFYFGAAAGFLAGALATGLAAPLVGVVAFAAVSDFFEATTVFFGEAAGFLAG
jgi:hypothetical protein